MGFSVGSSSQEMERARGLARVARALAELEDQETALKEVCEQVRHVLGTTASAINLLDEGGEFFHWSAQCGHPETFPLEPIPWQLFDAFAAGFEPILSETRPEVVRADPRLAMFSVHGLQAFATIPVRRSGRLLGLITAASYGTTRAPFDASEAVWLQTVGDMVVQEVLRQRALFAARESEARYKRIVSTIRDGVWAIDADQRTEYVNPQMADMLGYRVEELIGNRAPELNESWPGAGYKRWADRQQGRAERYEVHFRRKDGKEVYASVSAAPLFDKEGNFSGSLSVVTDITEQRKLELKLQQTQKLESLGILAGGIAHDFNNLLVAMLGNASLGLEIVRDDSELVPIFIDIRSAAQRAAELTRQMLAYSGRGRFVVRDLELNALIRETANLIGTVMPKNAELQLVLSPGLP
ncbi:MAG TPA: PAS domain S-box protein, partial [Polyangiaceae bacterium]|nr:PAS domain S-box protein [Polyangiaceae bacterium]